MNSVKIATQLKWPKCSLVILGKFRISFMPLLESSIITAYRLSYEISPFLLYELVSGFDSNRTLLHHEGVLEPRSESCKSVQMQSSAINNSTFIAAVAPHSKSPHTVLISTSLARCRQPSITARTRMWGALPLFYHFHKQTFPTRFRQTPDPPICKSRTRLRSSRLSSVLTNI